MNQIEEIWKQLPNIDKNQYAISNLGRIINTKTKVFVRAYIHKSRDNYYLRVALGKKKYMVHVLVALMFHEKPNTDCTEVHHRDFNTLNPAATNLEWATRYHNKSEMHRSRIVKFGGETFRAFKNKFNLKKKI